MLRPLSGIAGRHLLLTTDAVGGVWTYSLDLAAGLAARGARVTIAVLGPAPDRRQGEAAAALPGCRLVATGLPLDWTATSPGQVLEAGRALAELARTVGADGVHLHGPALAVDAAYPGPVVAVCHSCVATWWAAVETGPMPADLAWRGDLVAQGCREVDRLVAPTRAFAEATAAAYGLAEVPTVVPNGRRFTSPHGGEVESAAGAPGEGVAPFPDSALPLTLPSPRWGEGSSRSACVLMAGRLWDRAKNVAALERVAPRLAWPVLAAGALQGPNGDRVALRAVQALGCLDEAELRALLAAQPVFASPALYEPFGLAVLEAAHAGCPLVLSDIPTFRELWEGAALFVPARDDDALAAALNGLAADAASRARWGEAARARAARYTPDAMVEGVAAVHAGLLDRAPGLRDAAA